LQHFHRCPAAYENTIAQRDACTPLPARRVDPSIPPRLTQAQANLPPTVCIPAASFSISRRLSMLSALLGPASATRRVPRPAPIYVNVCICYVCVVLSVLSWYPSWAGFRQRGRGVEARQVRARRAAAAAAGELPAAGRHRRRVVRGHLPARHRQDHGAGRMAPRQTTAIYT
jgi:hypothetical protein